MKNTVKVIILLVLLVINNAGFAAHVSKSTAQGLAVAVANKGNNNLKSAGILSLVYAKENAFYVFGNESSFVIVAADDRVTPILGYSNEGPFIVPTSNDSTGNNFWGMLNSYEKQIDYVVANNIAATSKIANQWEGLKSGTVLKNATTAVTPLLTTNWDQGWPYNALCPTDANGPGGHVWAGCVATAMSQILKYHNYPNQGLGTYEYQSGIYPTTKANFGSTTYNWANMPNSISTQNNDVATLIYQTAVSVRSTWGPGNAGTGILYSPIADPITRGFVNYFKCAFSTIKFVESKNYTVTQWDNLLQTELLNKRPVYYCGESSNGGHAWVCDGFDTQNLYHFNWGWGGVNNGYFPLTAITPGTRNYTNNQDAIIGIQPNDGSTLVTNTLWSGSINNLTNIAVPDAVTLTVNAGALVKFAQNTKLQIFGKIVSTGTNINYTTFTAIDTTAGWWGIKFDNEYMNSEVMVDNDTSRFVYNQIQYSDMSGISIKNFNKVVIDHCIINNNYIDKNENGYDGRYGSGAGIFANNSKVIITHSKLYKNSATISGGGLYVYSDDNFVTIIHENEIFQNFAGSKGGGVCLSNTAIFSENLVHHNQSGSGAGIFLGESSTVSQISVVSNKFCNNIASRNGGGLYVQGCSPKIINNLIANNLSGSSTKGNGGGIGCSSNSNAQIINNTIVNNRSYQGGAISVELNYDGQVSLKNCIVYGNTSVNTGNQIMLGILSNFSPVFDHCNIQGGVNAFGGPGAGSNYTTANYTNNIDSNPLFVSPSTGAGSGYDGMVANWQLSSTSSSVNVGDVTGVSTLLPVNDLAGNARINGIIDMGAYEYQVSLLPVSVSIIVSANSVCSGSSVTFTATPVNGGTVPVYQWKKNGTVVGNNAATYSYIPVNGDVITCVLTSNLSNVTGSPATSNIITMSVNALPVTPNQPVGPDTVHSKLTITSTYTTTAVSNTDSYTWEIVPANAGSLSGTTTSVIVTWNTTYVGNVQLRVKSINTCGSSQYSMEKNIYVDLSTAINVVELQNNVKVFPNPCNGRFTILSDKEISALFMYDVCGKIVSFEAPILGTTVAVDCSNLPKGLYVVHAYMRDTKQYIIQKVIVK